MTFGSILGIFARDRECVVYAKRDKHDTDQTETRRGLPRRMRNPAAGWRCRVGQATHFSLTGVMLLTLARHGCLCNVLLRLVEHSVLSLQLLDPTQVLVGGPGQNRCRSVVDLSCARDESVVRVRGKVHRGLRDGTAS